MKRKIVAFLLLLWMIEIPVITCAQQNQTITVARHHIASGGGSNTFTKVQALAGQSCTIAAGTCNITVTSTGSGNLAIINYQQNGSGSADYITAVSGGCSGSWLIPAAAKINNASVGSANMAYCLSTTSGVTSITLSAPISGYARMWELSVSPGPAALDVCGTVNDTTTGTTQLGVALSLTGTSDEIVQQEEANANTNSISAPYGNFDHTNLATADNENTSSGTAPTWTLAATSVMIGAACAFK